ncbi:MAG: peptidyl-prolyl cis-trans isomerase [Bacteroidetes bacterium]|nr:peptidyl-prolyl cis-trans isomerase [Bacteroidota bacterium]
MPNRFLILLFVTFLSTGLFAQKDDPVLFSVDDTPVHLSEFKYIYSKTNGDKADYSKASLQEYLDLYTNFKLKVKKAKDMKLDTISSLKQELEGYRRQLADSYLIDREVTEKLVDEAYERTKQDVDISHIMVSFPPNASPADTLAAWNKIMEAKAKLERGEDFGATAMVYSTDKSVNKNLGHIGYVTALFPNGFYNLETAAYTAPIGKLQGPIRTNGGYHLLIVHGRRPARGEVEISHIMVRLDKFPDGIKARRAIDSLYSALQGGANFEELAKTGSMDQATAAKGGYIGFFGINRYEKPFEDAAFALQNDGDFSPPIMTSIGWHILKRISLKRDEPFTVVKSRLQNQIKQDTRYELARQKMIERIKKESNFTEDHTTLANFIATLEADTTKSFLTYKWKAPEVPSTKPLFSFGNSEKITLGDFAEYCAKASRKRQQMSGAGIAQTVENLYEDYVGETALKHEEKLLDTKYPEFKSLMREYEEGVMLFEVTKMEVWDKASADSVGLEAFYEKNKANYKWEERAVLSQYALVEKAKDKINQIREFAKHNDPETVLAKFNTDEDKILSRTEKQYEKGRNEVVDKMEWKVGALSPVDISKRDKSYNFFKLEEILQPGQKTLLEARGYVVADYQDYLEKRWLESLRKEYKVKTNEKVFNSMVKK